MYPRLGTSGLKEETQWATWIVCLGT